MSLPNPWTHIRDLLLLAAWTMGYRVLTSGFVVITQLERLLRARPTQTRPVQ